MFLAEVKNLQSRNNGPNGTRDVYCTVALDQEEISRTQTIERTLAPFFGNEFQFEIPRKFRYLAIYVWDRDRHLKQDKAIGKVAIKREELHAYNTRDHWFPLKEVSADSEVQGMIHIGVSFDEVAGNLKRKSAVDESTAASAFGSCSSDLKENCGNSRVNSLSRANTTNNFGSLGNKLLLRQSAQHFDNATTFSDIRSYDKCSVVAGSNQRRVVTLNNIQCTELAKKNGNCDPFVIVTAVYTNNKKSVKRTKVKKKTVNPNFDDALCFDLVVDYECKHSGSNTYTVAPLEGADLSEICVSVWHDAGINDSVFLGEVKLPMRDKQQQSAVQSSAWYYLHPRTSQYKTSRSCATPPGTRLSKANSLGSMRIQLVFTSDYVFPLATYDDLLNLLLKSLDQRPITTSAVYILGEIISSKTEVAQPLVRIFTFENSISPIIKALADHEISKLTDPTTIFRGNTLVSKMMDEAMRLSGLHYLHCTLRPIVKDIITERKPCEIDPTRVKEAGVVENNLVNLEEYVAKVFEAITTSAVRCPAILCQIFHDLRECAAKHFPHNKEVRYSVVSGFIFLRFFAPAILGPKLFDLTNEPLVSETFYSLINFCFYYFILNNIYKSIQNLPNY